MHLSLQDDTWTTTPPALRLFLLLPQAVAGAYHSRTERATTEVGETVKDPSRPLQAGGFPPEGGTFKRDRRHRGTTAAATTTTPPTATTAALPQRRTHSTGLPITKDTPQPCLPPRTRRATTLGLPPGTPSPQPTKTGATTGDTTTTTATPAAVPRGATTHTGRQSTRPQQPAAVTGIPTEIEGETGPPSSGTQQIPPPATEIIEEQLQETGGQETRGTTPLSTIPTTLVGMPAATAPETTKCQIGQEGGQGGGAWRERTGRHRINALD